MIIEIPECEFRIKGEEADWQIQYQRMKKGEQVWEGRHFYSQLEYAIEKAYELALRGSGVKGDLKDALAECKRVKSSLVKTVQKAVAGND